MFIDTNYFLRFFLRDIKEQNVLVEQFFIDAVDKKTPLVTSAVVFFEFNWVLGRYYKKRKEEKVLLLRNFLKLKFINLQDREMLIKTVDLFEKVGLDIEDCYNLFYAKKAGVSEFKTFDRKLKNEFDK